MIRTVIIGSGNIAHTRHIPNIRRSGLAVLHGIYNRSLEHSRKDAGELGCKAYTCLDEIWADSCVDAVIICTPASTHCRYTLAALAAGAGAGDGAAAGVADHEPLFLHAGRHRPLCRGA